MKVLALTAELARAKAISPEMAYRRVAEGATYEAGVIRFAPGAATNLKQITHADQDVLCYVLSGAGRLRAGGHETPLRPGLLCHIPANTPHDFAATTDPSPSTTASSAPADPEGVQAFDRSAVRLFPREQCGGGLLVRQLVGRARPSASVL